MSHPTPETVARRLREVARLSEDLLALGGRPAPPAEVVAARLEEACSLSTLCLSLVAAGARLGADGQGTGPE